MKMYSPESDSGWIEELSKNNRPPSDEAARRIKKLLLKPLKVLGDLDNEILDLKNRLSELEMRRSETEKQISYYQTILAPIRGIPTDVLGEIFCHCLPQNRNPIMKSTDCPLLLTRVCSRWRAVALSSPRLWDRLYITLTDSDSVPDLDVAAEMVRNGKNVPPGWQYTVTKSEKQHAAEILRRRCEGAREWLLRSGTRPLSISISFRIRHYWYPVPYSERSSSTLVEFFTSLATFAPRLKDLELKAPAKICETLGQMVAVSEMTMLTSCRIDISDRFQFRVSPEARHLMLLAAPNIREISLAGPRNLNIFATPLIGQWKKLTTISCFHSLSIPDTIFLLSNATNLIHYNGLISTSDPHDIAPTFHEGVISLPSLLTLSIGERIHPQRLGNIYDCIDAPMLQRIKYCNFTTSPLSAETMMNLNHRHIPILALLRKSTKLRKLWLNAHGLSRDMGNFLRAVPTITHLVLGSLDGVEQNLRLTPFPSSSSKMYDSSGNVILGMWSFEDFIVRSPSEETKPLLLPRLTSLIIYTEPPWSRLTDSTLFQLIKSRMTSNKTATLQHVKVIFCRKREKDIQEDLKRLEDQAGLKINLQLHYLVPHIQPSSPEYGLKGGPSGKSWPYTEPGEEL